MWVHRIPCVVLVLVWGCSGSGPASTGDTGDTGNTGDSGNTGDTGNTGDPGDTGDTGGPRCGDGSVNVAGELCDPPDFDGASCASLEAGVGQLGCASDCGAFDTTPCQPLGPATCGDGVLNGFDACDGAAFDEAYDSCAELGLGSGTLACTAACLYDLSGCERHDLCAGAGLYGNDVCDACERVGGGIDPDCVTFCSATPDGRCPESMMFPGFHTCQAHGTPDADCGPCGDGNAVEPEVCDGEDLGPWDCEGLGFAPEGQLGCTLDCTADVSACNPIFCGDGFVSAGEACEPGVADATCENLGFMGGTLRCAVDCQARDTSQCVPFPCGNQVIEGFEVCDGANVSGFACEDFYDLDLGVGVLVCLSDCSDYDFSGCPPAQCNNGVAEGQELCDGTDVRDARCTDNPQFLGGEVGCNATCDGLDTTACIGPTCGDGHAEGLEECDGADVRGQRCTDVGSGPGTLGCDACELDRSSCGPLLACCDGSLGAPGCAADAEIEACVCAEDDFCCTDNWDDACALLVDETGCGTCHGPPSCGNHATEEGETCDGTDLEGASCESLGLGEGDLRCLGDCSDYDTLECR